MRQLAMTAAAIATLFAMAAPADAAGGCGRGFHRGHYGRCVPGWHRHRWHRW